MRQIERFQWALAPALLCLLLSLWREFPVRPRVRSLPLAAAAGKRIPAGAGKPETGDRIRKSAGRGRRRRPTAAAAVILLVLLSGLRYPLSGFAAEDTSAYAAPLSKLVEQLSAQPAAFRRRLCLARPGDGHLGETAAGSGPAGDAGPGARRAGRSRRGRKAVPPGGRLAAVPEPAGGLAEEAARASPAATAATQQQQQAATAGTPQETSSNHKPESQPKPPPPRSPPRPTPAKPRRSAASRASRRGQRPIRLLCCPSRSWTSSATRIRPPNSSKCSTAGNANLPPRKVATGEALNVPSHSVRCLMPVDAVLRRRVGPARLLGAQRRLARLRAGQSAPAGVRKLRARRATRSCPPSTGWNSSSPARVRASRWRT